MRRVQPTAIRQPVVVPGLYQTGLTCLVADDRIDVILDGDGKRFTCSPGECFALRWHDRDIHGEFLYIAKAWVSYWDFTRKRGKRIVRVQKHPIRDGYIGRRHIILEFVAGELVQHL